MRITLTKKDGTAKTILDTSKLSPKRFYDKTKEKYEQAKAVSNLIKFIKDNPEMVAMMASIIQIDTAMKNQNPHIETAEFVEIPNNQ